MLDVVLFVCDAVYLFNIKIRCDFKFIVKRNLILFLCLPDYFLFSGIPSILMLFLHEQSSLILKCFFNSILSSFTSFFILFNLSLFNLIVFSIKFWFTVKLCSKPVFFVVRYLTLSYLDHIPAESFSFVTILFALIILVIDFL